MSHKPTLCDEMAESGVIVNLKKTNIFHFDLKNSIKFQYAQLVKTKTRLSYTVLLYCNTKFYVKSDKRVCAPALPLQFVSVVCLV